MITSRLQEAPPVRARRSAPRDFVQYCAFFLLLNAFLLPPVIGNLTWYASLMAAIVALSSRAVRQQLRPALFHPSTRLFLIGFALLAVVFAVNSQSLREAGSLVNFAPMLLFVVFAALFRAHATPCGLFAIACLSLAGTASSVISASIDVYALGLERAVGFASLTNPFAMCSALLGSLALLGFFCATGWKRFVFLAGPAMAMYSVNLAGTRSSMLQIAASLGVFAIFCIFRLPAKRRLPAIAAVFAVTAILLGTAALYGGSERALSGARTIMQVVTGEQQIDHSTALRLEFYKGGLQAFLEAPLIGHGWSHHVAAAHRYMADYAVELSLTMGHLHNDFVNFAAFGGLVGLAALICYLAAPIAGALAQPRDSQFQARLYCATVIVTNYVIFGMFDTSFAAEMLMSLAPIQTAALMFCCGPRNPNVTA